MPKFSIDYQRSHDIDWFVKIGNIYVHAMSFGGELPSEVNDRYKNTQVLLRAYRMPLLYEDYAVNDEYVNGRLGGDGVVDRKAGKRERYLRHFKEMAARGFYSFDRDLQNENVYHLIVRPAGMEIRNITFPDMPIITNVSLDWQSETNGIMHFNI